MTKKPLQEHNMDLMSLTWTSLNNRLDKCIWIENCWTDFKDPHNSLFVFSPSSARFLASVLSIFFLFWSVQICSTEIVVGPKRSNNCRCVLSTSAAYSTVHRFMCVYDVRMYMCLFYLLCWRMKDENSMKTFFFSMRNRFMVYNCF